MDFYTLARRDLQSLCKKNRIPANMTNVAMADALQALEIVEGIAEIQESLQFQSPKKLDIESSAPPRTGRRTTASQKVEQQGSPLPRSRRVIVKASDILDMVEDAESPKAPTTRSRVTKKQEIKVVAKTPATRRTTRQSSKKEVDDLLSGGLRRSNRVRGKGDSVKMASLAKEVEEEEENKEKVMEETEDAVDQKNDLCAEEEIKGKDKLNQENDRETNDQACEKQQKLEAEVITEAPISSIQSEESYESKEEVSENKEEESEEQNQDEALPGFNDSPIRGLMSSDQDSSLQQNPVAEINTEEIENLEISPEEKPAENVDPEFKIQELSIIGENSIEIEDSSVQTLEFPIACDQISPDEIQDLITSDLTEEIAKLTIESSKDDRDITGEIQGLVKSDLTAEISNKTIESGANPKDDDLNLEITSESDDLTVEVPVKIDESGDFPGEISVEAIGDLNLSSVGKSAGKELPVTGIYKDDTNKENGDLTALTISVVGPIKAEKQNYQSMSLRKLKAVYRETLVTINNKGEDKRIALGVLNQNCI